MHYLIFSRNVQICFISYIIVIAYISRPRPEDVNPIPSFAFLPVEAYEDDYNMNHARRGRAIIFNHENFLPHLGNPVRTGTALDRDGLYLRLRELEFDVTCYNDLTFNQIKMVIATCKTR